MAALYDQGTRVRHVIPANVTDLQTKLHDEKRLKSYSACWISAMTLLSIIVYNDDDIMYLPCAIAHMLTKKSRKKLKM